jgi:alpha-L-fucosidase
VEENNKPKGLKQWWEKPGFSIQYQIEARPGWIWNRNYDKFNATMKDKNGKLKFNGPFCKMKKWVEFSKKVGVDYHAFESKWHDGICYWDTKCTKWKTPEDYCKIYAEESRKAQIPFLFYYSSIIDHNPDFDDIQPVRGITPSFIAMHSKEKKKIIDLSMKMAKLTEYANGEEAKKRNIPYNVEFFDDVHEHDFTNKPEIYENYMLNQIKELIDNYKPSGIWCDWYFGKKECSAPLIMDFMEKNYPEIVLAFNNSLVGINLKWSHYLAGEAHNIEVAWKLSNFYRKSVKPWELIGPATYAWDVPLARPDPYEIVRLAAITMANGGKICFGLPSQMDGELFPEPAQNLEIFGNWYKSRHFLFTESIPMIYEGEEVPGIQLNEKDFGTIGNVNEGDMLVHLINFKGLKKDIKIVFTQKLWENIKKIILEPIKKELQYKKKKDGTYLLLDTNNIDLVDTILRVSI